MAKQGATSAATKGRFSHKLFYQVLEKEYAEFYSQALLTDYRRESEACKTELKAKLAAAKREANPVKSKALEEGAYQACNAEHLKKLYTLNHGEEKGLAALCLSGGGIRSATFALGVV